jgi:hypothetical protein
METKQYRVHALAEQIKLLMGMCWAIPIILFLDILLTYLGYFQYYSHAILVCLILFAMPSILRVWGKLTINADGIFARFALIGTRTALKWDEVTEIRYNPLLFCVIVRSSFLSYIRVDYLFKNYKHAWRDIVIQAQGNNPDISISPKLVKNLEKKKLL